MHSTPRATSDGGRRGVRGLLINRNYALFTVGSFVTATGSWIQSVALGWLVLELGNSDFLLGLVGFARMVPLLILSFPAGALADRFDRRKMMFFSQLGGFAAAAMLAGSVWLGLATIPLIVALALVAGLADAFSWPVWSVFIKDLVGPEKLRHAVAVNSTRFNMTRIVGPTIGGFVLAAYGVPVCFAISTCCAIGIMAALLFIRVPPYPKRVHGPWLPALKEGIAYAAGEPDVRRLLVITAGLGLFALPYQQLLAAVARDGLDSGPEGLGLLTSAVGVGAIVGAVLTGTGRVQRRSASVVLWLPIGVGAALALLALACLLVSMPLGALSLAWVGLFSIAYMSIAGATLQLMVRDEVVGRVMGLWTVVQAGVQPVGSLALGEMADLAGLPATFMLAGIGAAGVALALGRRPLGVLPAAERDERRAQADQQQRRGYVGRALQGLGRRPVR